MAEQQLRPCQKTPMLGVSFCVLQLMWLHDAHSSEEAPHLLDTTKSTFWWEGKKIPLFPYHLH